MKCRFCTASGGPAVNISQRLGIVVMRGTGELGRTARIDVVPAHNGKSRCQSFDLGRRLMDGAITGMRSQHAENGGDRCGDCCVVRLIILAEAGANVVTLN